MRRALGAALTAVALLSSGCYWNQSVQPNEVGVQLSGGGIVGVVGEGLYSDFGFYASLDRMSRDPIDFEVKDAQVATREKQLVGVELNIKVQRPSQPDRVEALWRSFNNLARDDKAIPQILNGPALQSIKVNVAQFTLDELLADRNKLRDAIFQELEVRARQYNLDVLSVDVSNVALDPNYAEELQKRQLVNQARITAEQERLLIEQQTNNERFKAEQDKQTALATAQRDKEVAQLQAERDKAVALTNAQRDLEVARLQAESQRVKADATSYEVKQVAASITAPYVQFLQASRWDGTLPAAIYGNAPIPIIGVPPSAGRGQPPATVP